MHVRYRDIAGFPNYQIGDDGSVRSRRALGRRLKDTRDKPLVQPKWKSMKTPVLPSGYPSVALRHNGKVKTLLIHRLVLEAFVGPCPAGMEACHYPDRSRTNCELSNLRWDTRQSNSNDQDKHGTRARGEKNGHAVMTEKKVTRAHKLHTEKGMGVCELARRYKVCHGTMGALLRGDTWKYLTERTGA